MFNLGSRYCDRGRHNLYTSLRKMNKKKGVNERVTNKGYGLTNCFTSIIVIERTKTLGPENVGFYRVLCLLSYDT